MGKPHTALAWENTGKTTSAKFTGFSMYVQNEPGRAAEFSQQEIYSPVPSFIKQTHKKSVFLLIEK